MRMLFSVLPFHHRNAYLQQTKRDILIMRKLRLEIVIRELTEKFNSSQIVTQFWLINLELLFPVIFKVIAVKLSFLELQYLPEKLNFFKIISQILSQTVVSKVITVKLSFSNFLELL